MKRRRWRGSILVLLGLASYACFPDFEALNECSDSQKGSLESDVDCGGPACRPCPSGRACGAASDCASGACSDGRCAGSGDGACQNGDRDANESGVDCGGASDCGPCPNGEGCAVPGDCASGACDGRVCVPDRCLNDRVDADESDVDCGGSSECPRCADGALCTEAGDCRSMLCDGACYGDPCSNGERDDGETDLDCGGDNACDRCAPGARCEETSDCDGGVCQGGRCVEVDPCENRRLDGTETDIDCGGSCRACPEGADCVIGRDCETGRCEDRACAPLLPTCTDDALNGDETDVDCGGSCKPGRRCEAEASCVIAADCQSFVCTNRKCAAEIPIPSADLIDDMEDNNGTSPTIGGRGGTQWYEANDAAGTSVVEFPAVIQNGRPSSSYGIHYRGSGFAIWGAAIGLDLRPWSNGAQLYDASIYAGISFWAKAAAPGQRLAVNIIDKNTTGAVTPPNCTTCEDYHTVNITLTDEWARYDLRFDAARQNFWGVPQVTNVDEQSIVALRFASWAGDVFDFWIDDVAFFRE